MLQDNYGLKCLSKDWKSLVYAFYHPVPDVIYVKGRRCHEFKCAAHGCKYTSRRYLDMKDKSSTGNLIKHAKSCWGNEAWKAVNDCKNATEARESVMEPITKSGSITGKVTYSHWMHTKTETNLMKTGRLEYYIPSVSTVSRNVRLMLQEYDGDISFATDAWMSPNHYAYVALTAHLEAQGQPISIVLDVVEVPKVHLTLIAFGLTDVPVTVTFRDQSRHCLC
ncbi:hypothetical protein BJV74DRAFT_879180 [Russula compacta]|nr:hypothetical protein BJV74DRAFT_879180 [Russula compacta]